MPEISDNALPLKKNATSRSVFLRFAFTLPWPENKETQNIYRKCKLALVFEEFHLGLVSRVFCQSLYLSTLTYSHHLLVSHQLLPERVSDMARHGDRLLHVDTTF